MTAVAVPDRQEHVGPRVVLLVIAWIVTSAACVLMNKHILFYLDFRFPAMLATCHMITAWVVTSAVIHLTANGNKHLPPQADVNKVPYRSLAAIGTLYAVVLMLSNSAFMYLSVPSIQMLKASGCAVTLLSGLALGNETYSHSSLCKVLLVGSGVLIASYGDIQANALGITIQLSSILADAVRCNLLQVVMQRTGVKLTPVGTLYYVAPMAALALCLPAILYEGGRLLHHHRAIPTIWLIGSCALSACLNLVVFSLIGSTSALTTSITGPLKEWACILVSMNVYGNVVTQQQWFGYAIAVGGIFWYQQDKFKVLVPQQVAPQVVNVMVSASPTGYLVAESKPEQQV